MSFVNEGRDSTSPYIESIWRGRAGRECFPNCPADGRWHMLLLKEKGCARISVAGPMTKAKINSHAEGVEWLVIKFRLGIFIPRFTARTMVDQHIALPEATSTTFCLSGSAWEYPDYDNVETFVNRLARNDLVVGDHVVSAALEDRLLDLSPRTVRHHFLQATDVTQSTIRQIERAQLAVSLLEQGLSISDTVYQAGYADQPHLTRSLKHFMGQTPAQIVTLTVPQ